MAAPQCTGHPRLSRSVKSLGRNLTSRVCSCTCTVCNQNKEAAATCGHVAMSFPSLGRGCRSGPPGSRAAQTFLMKVTCSLSLKSTWWSVHELVIRGACPRRLPRTGGPRLLHLLQPGSPCSVLLPGCPQLPPQLLAKCWHPGSLPSLCCLSSSMSSSTPSALSSRPPGPVPGLANCQKKLPHSSTCPDVAPAPRWE